MQTPDYILYTGLAGGLLNILVAVVTQMMGSGLPEMN